MASVGVALLAIDAASARAETGYDAWLRYAPIDDRAARERYDTLPAVVVALGDSRDRRRRPGGAHPRRPRHARPHAPRRQAKFPTEGAIILGTFDAVTARCPPLGKPPELPPDGFWLKIDHRRRQEPPGRHRAERTRRSLRRVRAAADDRPRSRRSPISTSATSPTPRSASSTIGTTSTARSNAATPAGRSFGRTATSPKTSAASATTPG